MPEQNRSPEELQRLADEAAGDSNRTAEDDAAPNDKDGLVDQSAESAPSNNEADEKEEVGDLVEDPGPDPGTPSEAESATPDAPGRWLAFHAPNRESVLQVGQILTEIDADTLRVRVPANPEQLQEVDTQEQVQRANVIYFFPAGDPEPRSIARVENGFETKPWFGDGGQPRFLDHATITNHPEGSDPSHLTEMWDGSNLMLKLSNRMPSANVTLVLEGVVDVDRAKTWLLSPSTRMLESPRIFSSSDTKGVRALCDIRMDPERIAFSGRWTLVTD